MAVSFDDLQGLIASLLILKCSAGITGVEYTCRVHWDGPDIPGMCLWFYVFHCHALQCTHFKAINKKNILYRDSAGPTTGRDKV